MAGQSPSHHRPRLLPAALPALGGISRPICGARARGARRRRQEAGRSCGLGWDGGFSAGNCHLEAISGAGGREPPSRGHTRRPALRGPSRPARSLPRPPGGPHHALPSPRLPSPRLAAGAGVGQPVSEPDGAGQLHWGRRSVSASAGALDIGLEKPTHPLLSLPAPQPSSPLCFLSLWWLGIIIAKWGGTRRGRADGRGAAPSSLTPCLSRSLANIPLTPETQRDQERRIRREIANSNERRRMQSINAGFQSLKTLIPHTDGEKLSKVSETSLGLRRCRMQTPVLHVEVFVVACQAGQGCKSNWGYLHMSIQRWRALLGRFPWWERVCIANPVSWSGLGVCDSTQRPGSRVVCAWVTRWPRCRGEWGEKAALSSRLGS